MGPLADVTEQKRLNDAREAHIPWKKWGPYLSERQWGTVREDYSEDGNAWDYFTHDQARSRTYRWGEDGLGGLCDDKQRLCFALALWNERDPILKERLFGLTNSQANHGEDVKEYYFYIDSTPTHSYMKYLYKYPQREYPYRDLIDTNRGRSRKELEYELLDTGVFGDDRYFDVFVEYAKENPEDILVRITVHNRGPEAARLRVLPTLWFRNTWSWDADQPKPLLREVGPGVIQATHHELSEYWLLCDGAPELLFTENESNAGRLWGQPNASPYVKDGFHDYIIAGRNEAVNPAKVGTKAAAHYVLDVPAGGSQTVRLRLMAVKSPDAFGRFEVIVNSRIADADEFYDRISPKSLSDDERRVHRQALAGMLWSKQYYFFDVDQWLQQHKSHPLMESARRGIRNTEWFHMLNADVISMPDKWEYPWYAAWDLAFHTIALAMVDFDFAKDQLLLLLRSLYAHPNGQIPAYEWNFSDVNPPVHAWATLYLYKMERTLGRGDLRFLERSFHGLMLNFNWWVNRKDPDGRNVFAGGFLGLDNIGVFDRSAPLPTGGTLEQADGTAWMAFYCQCMLEMALILSENDPVYEETAFKFVEHFLWISYAMDRLGEQHDEMWDEDDGFFYDLLRLPDGQAMRLKVRSMVGLLPLCASTVFEGHAVERHPKLREMIDLFRRRHPSIVSHVAPTDGGFIGFKGRRLLSILNKQKLERVLGYMLDEDEFLGPHGIRSLSRHHLEHPFVFHVGGQEYKVQYLPAESDTGMFGGNSNWRGPVWMPINVLLVRALLNLYSFYGDEFKIQCPTGSGRFMTLFEVAREISRRLSSTFLREPTTGSGQAGRRPVYGGTAKFQDDPHWRDLILFYEYFHGDNGAGLGASHQTGWTGLVARLLDLFGRVDAKDLELGLAQLSDRLVTEQVRGEQRTGGLRIRMFGPRYPSLYQVNTRVWLTELARTLGRAATLDDVPDASLDRLSEQGFDWVWLLSVWQTGPAAQAISRASPEWRREFVETLPDLNEEDIGGSGFAIQSYSVHRDLGGDSALARLRQRLHPRGLKLMLDFVPNHMAPDHPWIDEHPDYFVHGTESDVARSPRNYCRVATQHGSLLLAFGRDPYFEGWPDTLQLNYGNPQLQRAMIAELERIAGQCDGVRCDMAMLVLPDVFERTWGIRTEPFWPKATGSVRRKHPNFQFMAEVYWDREWTLQQQGFDYTYDKRLYDRLREGHARPVREHFHAGLDYQNKMGRFMENHDERRAAATFPADVHQAAAVITFLSPGLRFLHQGQCQGRRTRISPHLVRGPQEPIDQRLTQFYDRLLAVLRRGVVRDGDWQLLDCTPAWDGNWTWDGFLVFAWQGAADERLLVAVNYAPHQSQCYVQLPFAELGNGRWRLHDVIGDATYDREGSDLQARGLYLDEPPWQCHAFAVTKQAAAQVF